jgi:hypothetical protein
MDGSLIPTVVGAGATIVAGLLGGAVGRSELWDRLTAKKRFAKLVGTRWESKWTDYLDGVPTERREIIEFTAQKRDRVYGYITMDVYPDLKWEVEGDYNETFLRLLWHPSPKAENKFFIDYGCYFFKRMGKGYFQGYAIGFDSQTDKIDFGEHTLKQL